MHRPRILSRIFAALFVTATVAQAASCALDTSGSSQEPETKEPCTTAANCTSGDSCSVATCGDDGLCVYTPLADGPNPAQTVGDCMRIDCKGGKESPVVDAADVPDDNEPCTDDVCTGGTPSNVPIANGGTCTRGPQTGTCEMGVCQISCDAQNPCNDANPCTDDFCNVATGKCIFTNIDGLPTPDVAQPTGDCKQQICVNGKDTAVTDDTDVLVDPNDCTDNICTNGVPSNPFSAAGQYCVQGQPDVCDGNGNCVECTLPEHCVGITETDCTKRDCVANKCVPKYLGNETTAGAASQTTGDCKRVVCNGTDGGTVTINDNSDKPNDNNACTTDSCSNGNKVFTNVAQGTSCGGMNVCDDAGKCVGCNSPNDCQGTDDFCKQRTCINKVCGVSYTADGTLTPTGQTSMDCKKQVCDGSGNFVIRADTTDILPDGNDCTADTCSGQGNPVYTNTASGSACNQNGGDVCNGNGQCKKSNSKNCGANNECLSTNCVDSVCCNSGCTGTCKACNVSGSVGTCSNVPTGQDDSPSCTGSSVSCNGSGQCKKEVGQGCAGNNDCLNGTCVDGFCCQSSCTATCKACNVSGSEGQCVNIPAGQTDPNASMTCTGTNQCDGSGNCKKASGSCSVAGDCITGNCVDNFCCDTTCTDVCKACNLPGKEGTCSSVGVGLSDPGCGGTEVCDATGACKVKTGETCPANASDCLSGICEDGVCCSMTCGSMCMACNVSGSVGACVNVPNGTQDAPMCSGMGESCDGMGACKKSNGTACGAGSECFSNNCVDGVCCESACDTTCFQCNGGVPGLCVPISQFQEDNNPVGACTGVNSCDGSGTGMMACKLDNGQNCSGNGDCASGYCHSNGKCQ